VINLQISNTAMNSAAAPTLRVGVRLFWLATIALAGVLASMVLLLIQQIPATTPLSQSEQLEQVRTFILDSDSVRDPWIEITPTVIERSSAVRGLSFAGETYYYYFEGRQGYDPLSLGRIREDQIERMLRDDGGELPLVIYRLRVSP
jgi:hypothetical protein